jgi:hypothetical protein
MLRDTYAQGVRTEIVTFPSYISISWPYAAIKYEVHAFHE